MGVPWAGEQNAMSWGVQHHSQGSGPTGEERWQCWGGQEEEGADRHRNLFLCTYMHGLSEGGAFLAQDMGGKRPLDQAMGDWASLVWTMGGQAPLCGLWAGGDK